VLLIGEPVAWQIEGGKGKRGRAEKGGRSHSPSPFLHPFLQFSVQFLPSGDFELPGQWG